MDRQALRLFPLHPPRPRIEQVAARLGSECADIGVRYNILHQRSHPSQHGTTMAISKWRQILANPRALDRNGHHEHPNRPHRHRNVHLSSLGPEHGIQVQVARHHSLHLASLRHSRDYCATGDSEPRAGRRSLIFVQPTSGHDTARNVLQPHHDDTPMSAPLLDGVE
jgi:hypothetical protein